MNVFKKTEKLEYDFKPVDLCNEDMIIIESNVPSTLSPEEMEKIRAIAKSNSDVLDKMMSNYK